MTMANIGIPDDWRSKRCGHNFEPEACPNKHCGFRDTIAKIAELQDKLTRIMSQIQADQPPGSPPPGDEVMLTAWVLSNLRREASGYRADHDKLQAEVELLRKTNKSETERLTAMRASCVNNPCHHPPQLIGEWEDGTRHCWECEWYTSQAEIAALRDQYAAGWRAGAKETFTNIAGQVAGAMADFKLPEPTEPDHATT